MALVLQDRVQEIATANTTVSFTLVGAVTGFQSFSIIGDTNTTYYAATDTYGNWEVGIGTYSTTGPTLTRTTILSSSNAGSAVTFSSDSGAVNVFCTYPSERALYVDSAGTTFNAPNTVITSSSSSPALTVTQTGAGNALLVEDSASPDSTPFVIDTNGRVITGKTSAITFVSGLAPQIQTLGSTNSLSADGVGRFSADVSAGYFAFLKSRNTTVGTIGAPSGAVANNDALGSILWIADDGATGIQAAQIAAVVDGAPGTNDMPTRLTFSTTADGASSLTERMRIDNAGQVQIGSSGATTAGRSLAITKNITGGASGTSYGVLLASTVLNDVSANARLFNALVALQTGTALTQLAYFRTEQGSFSGSSVGSQYGFLADSTLIGATNDYGFYGAIPFGTGQYNLYMQGTADNYMAGALGIGATALTGYSLRVNKDLTGATTAVAVDVSPVIQSVVTVSGTAFRTQMTTAASITVGNITHYNATQLTLGSASTVTNQYGYIAGASLVDASNNYGFYGNIPAATNRWNLYMQGTANNYMAGSLGIGATSVTSDALRIAKTITGGTASTGVSITSVVQSDVTSDARYYRTSAATAAAAFTLPTLNHFFAAQGTFGASSVVTNQAAFQIETNITGATNNYGFLGAIPAPTSGITTTGTVSSISSSGTTVTVNHSAGTYTVGQIVTVTATANATALVSGVPCTILTLGNTDWNALAGTTGVTYAIGSTLTTAIAGSGTGVVTLNIQGSGKTVAGAASGSFTFTSTTSQTFAAVTTTGSVVVSTRWNLYMQGTADNYMAGRLGIGTTSLTDRVLAVGANISGGATSSGTAYGVAVNSTIQSDVTSVSQIYRSSPSTQATSFTLTDLYHYTANQGTIGSGSSITRQYGFIAGASLVGALTANYGFYGDIPAATGRYNLYMAGTAQNWFNGDVLIYGAGGLGYTTGSGGAVTQLTSRTTGVTLNKTNGAITLFSAAGSITATTFTVTNSTVAATDVIHVSQKSGTNLYIAMVTATAAGSFNITFYTTGGVATDAPVFNFAVIKAVTA